MKKIKTANKRPAFLFYTGDWMKDPALSMCAPSTRGIWVDLLCAMYEQDHDRTGIIQGTLEQLARVCRCNVSELRNALDELEKTGAANVTFPLHVTPGNSEITVTSRRLYREHIQRTSTAERVAKHREKRKCNDALSVSVSVSTSKQGKVVEQKEVDSQGASTAVSASVDLVFDYWRVTLKHATAKLTPKRRAKIAARLKDGYTVEDIKAGIDGNASSAFHQGDNENGGRVYDDLELICRSGEKLEQFIQISKGTPNNGIIRRNTSRRETRHERIKRETRELFAPRNDDPLNSAIAIFPRAIGNGTD